MAVAVAEAVRGQDVPQVRMTATEVARKHDARTSRMIDEAIE
jgi:hypothetical protein